MVDPSERWSRVSNVAVDHLAEAPAVLRIHVQVGRVGVLNCLGVRVAEDAHERLVGVHEAPLGAHPVEADREVIKHPPVTLLAVAQGLLGALALEGVADRALELVRIHPPLHQVVRGPGLHGFHVHVVAAASGQHDHGLADPELARLTHQLEPVAILQEVVDQVDVVLVRSEGVQPLLVGRHPVEGDRRALDLADHGERHLEIPLIVVDQQDTDRV